jgi:hypothetical protein
MPAAQIDALSLAPVIEFEPGRYKREKRDFPRVSRAEAPDEWQRYWLACLADAGIAELLPIGAGGWLVPASTITRPETLRRLIDASLSTCGLEAERLPDALGGSPLDKRLSALDGGFVIASQGSTLAEPACCGDLGDLVGFRGALMFDDGEWRPIWTGHDGASVAARRGGLELRIDAAEYALSPGLLAAAVGAASQELDALEARILSVAREMVPPGLADELARCLVGRPA